VKQYLEPFARWPKSSVWSFGGIKAVGTTFTAGDEEYRVLMVKVPEKTETGDVVTATWDTTDMLDFKQRFFGESAEVVVALPSIDQSALTLRMWERLNGKILPGRKGEPFGSAILHQ
jgi:hypothetical protein